MLDEALILGVPDELGEKLPLGVGVSLAVCAWLLLGLGLSVCVCVSVKVCETVTENDAVADSLLVADIDDVPVDETVA